MVFLTMILALMVCFSSLCGRCPKGVGEGKDKRIKGGKIGPSPSRAYFDFPSFLRPATQAMFFQYVQSFIISLSNRFTIPLCMFFFPDRHV